MTTREDKRWEMIQRAIAAGASGEEPQAVVSKRTLFGIKSSIEEQMDAIALEMSEKSRRKREESAD